MIGVDLLEKMVKSYLLDRGNLVEDFRDNFEDLLMEYCPESEEHNSPRRSFKAFF